MFNLSKVIYTIMLIAGFSVNLSAQTFTLVTSGDIVKDDPMSFGHSWTDYNNDGFPDLLVNNPNSGEPNLFYENNGDATFTKLLSPAIVQSGPTSSSCWGDFDNDGDADVFLANGGTSGAALSWLYRNDGDGQFSAVATAAFNTVSAFTVCSWVDNDNDGDLDLFLGRSSGNNLFFVNRGEENFVKIDLPDNGGTWGASWIDYDLDGDMDLCAANYGRQNYLYRNDGAALNRVSSGPVVAQSNRSLSASWGDYDNDGDFDLFIANAGGRNRLFANDGTGSFSELSNNPIVEASENSESSCWVDIDNDADLDLIVSGGGNVAIGTNAIFINDGLGNFTRTTTGDMVTLPGRYEGLSCIDVERDGDQDVFISNYRSFASLLYLNDGNDNNWIDIKCQGQQSNRDGIGSRVTVAVSIGGEQRRQIRQITTHTGHVAQGSLSAHFGLANASIIDEIVVEWPSGTRDILQDVAVNQFLTIIEGESPTSIDGQAEITAKAFDLSQNFPNPFNPSTTIRYEISQPARISLSIQNMRGRTIRTILKEELPAGSFVTEWDGHDDSGNRVSSGLYFYRLEGELLSGPGFSETQKMILLK